MPAHPTIHGAPVVANHLNTRVWSFVIAVVAALCYLKRQQSGAAIELWYSERLAAMGFETPSSASSSLSSAPPFVAVDRVMTSLTLEEYEQSARTLAQQAVFKQFIAKSKMPADPRWVFPPNGDDSNTRCPAMTFLRAPKECVFHRKPGQILWNLAQGGIHARRESLTALASRSSFFRSDFYESRSRLSNGRAAHPRFANSSFLTALRDDPVLVAAAKRLYHNATLVEPYAVYGNLLLPEQELPLHTDVTAYRGLDRNALPVWLLCAMHNSRLFDSFKLKIATAVLTFPSKRMKTDAQAQANGDGAFVFHPDSLQAPRTRASTALGSAIIADTDSIFHGVQAPGGRGMRAPLHILPDGMSKFDLAAERSLSTLLTHSDRAYADGLMKAADPNSVTAPAGKVKKVIKTRTRESGFELLALRRGSASEYEPRTGTCDFYFSISCMTEYYANIMILYNDYYCHAGTAMQWSDLRYSLSWKAIVHADEAERLAAINPANALTVDAVFGTFRDDLTKRFGVGVESMKAMSHFDLAFTIVKHYCLPYAPPNPSWLSWNVCAIEEAAAEVGWGWAGWGFGSVMRVLLVC